MQYLIPAIKAWLASNRNPSQLSTADTPAITHELRLWIARRKAHNTTLLQLMEEIIASGPELDALQYPSGVNGAPVPAAVTTSLRLMNLGQPYIKMEASENLIATYLLSTLTHRGMDTAPLPSTPRCAIDARVCSYLSTVDHAFNAFTELHILEDTERNDAIAAQLAALGPVPEDGSEGLMIRGLTKERSEEVERCFGEELRRYPEISVKEAFVNANVRVFGEGFLAVVEGRRTLGDFFEYLPKRKEDANTGMPDTDTQGSADGVVESDAAAVGQGDSCTISGHADEGVDTSVEEAKSKNEKNRERREQRKRVANKRKAETVTVLTGVDDDEGIYMMDSESN